MSTITALPYIAQSSEASPENFNRNFRGLWDNIASVNSSFVAGQNVSGVSITVPSSTSDYLYFQDSLAQKSSYIIGSHVGGTADGLNIWDASGSTLIASFSKQSIRFYQNVIGPVFDVGGSLTNTLNAASFGVGTDSKESRIQAAINQAASSGVSRVYVPSNMYPYSCSSVSFIDAVQMVREGGDQIQFDIKAYGAKGDRVQDDTNAIISAISGVVAVRGGTVFIPPGFYKTTQTIYQPRWVNFQGVGFHAPGNTLDGISVICGVHSGAAILSLKGSHACRISDLLLFSNTTTPFPKTGLCIGRNGTASAGLHGITRVNVQGFYSAAAVYQIASEENTVIDLQIYLQGGGALAGLYLAQGDSLAVDTLGSSSHIDSNFHNIRVSSEVTSDSGACISISGGASSGDFNFFGGYLLPSAGDYVYLVVNQDGSSMSRGCHFYGLSGEMNPAGSGPRYGYHFESSGALSASVEIIGSYMPLRAGGNFLKLESTARLVNSRIVVPTPDRTSAYASSQFSRGELDLGQGRQLFGDISMQDLGRVSVSGDNTSGIYFGDGSGLTTPRIRHQSAASQLQVTTNDGAGFYGLATGALITYSTLDANDVVTFDRAAGAGGGTFVQLKSGAARFGIVGCSGAIIGNTATNLAFWADSGKAIAMFGGGSTTSAIEVLSDNTVRYGSLVNLNQQRLLSMRTLAASSITVSAANTNVRADEIVFTIGGASGASFMIHSGGTVYGFTSSFSAKAT